MLLTAVTHLENSRSWKFRALFLKRFELSEAVERLERAASWNAASHLQLSRRATGSASRYFVGARFNRQIDGFELARDHSPIQWTDSWGDGGRHLATPSYAGKPHGPGKNFPENQSGTGAGENGQGDQVMQKRIEACQD